jgi:hypothetical protein
MRLQIISLLLGLASAALLQAYKPQQRLADQIVFDFNENFSTFTAPTLRAMAFGYSHAASGLLWLRFLEQTPPRKIGKNQVSWIYRDLDAITELDPDFYPAYEYGGIFLSVITEDKRGAEQILLKGTKAFPARWRIRAYLAYHYQWELGEPEKAAAQYLVGAKLPGAPYLLGVLASSYLTKSAGNEAGIHFLENLLRDTKDPGMRDKFKAKLQKLREGRHSEWRDRNSDKRA